MEPDQQVVLYQRPGCMFCLALRLRLHRAGVPFAEVDIWRDLAAAAEVRDHAGGNETVPTVRVGGQVLVNPSARAVLAAARTEGIELPETSTRRPWWALRRDGH